MNNPTMTFHQRLQQNQVVLAPGIYDALSALIAEQSGFEALYLSGASIAYTRLGRSDVGLTTATEVADTLARITERVSLPVIVDADTGFGNALNVQRTVLAFEVFAVVYALAGRDLPVLVGEAYGWQGAYQNNHVAAAYALLILGLSIGATLVILCLLRVNRETLA